MGTYIGWVFACGGWIECGSREIVDFGGEELINDALIGAFFRESSAFWFSDVNLVRSYCSNKGWEII